MICKHCGKEIANDYRFCPYCAKAVKIKKEKQIKSKTSLKEAVQSIYTKTAWQLSENLNKRDNIQYCPQCGSHDIKIYRKGYDYRPGFWGALFGVRGAGYVGGFDANKACCHCMDCGKDWETDYDYRKL